MAGRGPSAGRTQTQRGQEPPGAPASRLPARERRRRRMMRRRVVAAALIVVLGFFGWAVTSALSTPGSTPASIKLVEWVRGHGGAPIVQVAENVWYSWNAPPIGGRPPAGAIPAAGAAVRGAPRRLSPTTTAPAAYLPTPAPIAAIASPPLPGEGTWHPMGRLVNGRPAIYATYLRPDTVHTSLVASVAWMDTKLLRAQLAAGNQVPGGSWPLSSPIPAAIRPSLVAAFNSAFRLQDSQGGYYANGHLSVPLVAGKASLVIYRNGTINVGAWGQQVTMTPQVSAVRQNLQLLVNNRQPVPGLGQQNFSVWGATVGNQVLVWRSGIGVTSNGAVVYAAGPGLSVQSLANLLVRAGAVRAMELDINTDWVNFFTFNPLPGQPASPANGTPLLSTMLRPPSRYFGATARDFVVMTARAHPLGG